MLFPINLRTVANYRKAFQPSRAKSDPVDARILVELMQKHPEKLEVWVAGCAQTRELRPWVESRRMLVGERGFTSAQAFMSDVGIAPVKEESGKKCWVYWRWSCPIADDPTRIQKAAVRRAVGEP